MSVGQSTMALVDRSVPEVPAPVRSMCADLAGVSAWLGPIASVVPWVSIAVGLGLWLLGLGAGVAIKLVRIVASFASFGGGSAA